MKPAKYYIAKARLSGLFSRALLGGFVLLTVAVAAIPFAQDSLTPYSVFVSGYTRSDGTQVPSYYRRPPGSVPHDEPYEVLRFFALLAFGFGTYLLGKPIWVFCCAAPEALLPEPGNAPPLPTRPEPVDNPTKQARARRDWRCMACDSPIAKGEVYRYAKVVTAGAIRRRYCDACAARLTGEHRSRRQRVREYEIALARRQEIIAQLVRKQFLAVYGCEIETRPNKRMEASRLKK